MRIILLLSLLIFASCASETTQDDSTNKIEEPKGTTASDIIRNPISANTPTDTINIPKIEFEETVYEFGTVNEGDKVKHAFKFTNVGKAPLIISHARSTCGCTIPKWPRNAFAPGESGVIDVVFNTQRKTKQQKKPVIITANTYPSVTKVYIKGFVTPDPNLEKKMMDELKKSAK